MGGVGEGIEDICSGCGKEEEEEARMERREKEREREARMERRENERKKEKEEEEEWGRKIKN